MRWRACSPGRPYVRSVHKLDLYRVFMTLVVRKNYLMDIRISRSKSRAFLRGRSPASLSAVRSEHDTYLQLPLSLSSHMPV